MSDERHGVKLVSQRNADDCLRCCIATLFQIPWEDAPATEPPPGIEPTDRSWSQHNIVAAWLRERGLFAWTIEATPKDAPVLRRGRMKHPGGSFTPADFVWPYPLVALHIGGGESPRGVSHSVVMKQGRMFHDPNPARDMTIDRITSLTVLCAWLPAEASS